MQLRIDKCSTFGMRKQDGKYVQYRPNLSINNESIPPVEIGSSFTYLGKVFDFEMNNQAAKVQLTEKLTRLLKTTSALNINPQQKLKILKVFIPSQLSFELRIYDFAYTWIEQTLDTLICNTVRDWMTFPISTCVQEILALPKNRGGFDIPSQKSTAQKLRLTQRFALKFNKSEDMQSIWSATSSKNINLDYLISEHACKKSALKSLSEAITQDNFDHISSLKIQGKIIKHLAESTTKSSLASWSSELEKLPAPLFIFTKKALQQQLPTASNLMRWGKADNPNCPLCQQVQTNKHVLSNCRSTLALDRYKDRHDSVLSLIANWISRAIKPDRLLHVDLVGQSFRPLSDLFQTLRPDIAILTPTCIDILELTICHETNTIKSRTFKESKYATLHQNLLDKYSELKLNIFTVEVTTLGIISDINSFSLANLNSNMPAQTISEIVRTVISKSFTIYCNRNNLA